MSASSLTTAMTRSSGTRCSSGPARRAGAARRPGRRRRTRARGALRRAGHRRCRATTAARRRAGSAAAPTRRDQQAASGTASTQAQCNAWSERLFMANSQNSGSRRCGRAAEIARIVRPQVPGHRAPQEIERAGADAREAVQLELRRRSTSVVVSVVVVSRCPTTRSAQQSPLYSTPATASSVLRSASE